jgi:GT2 family glycosyltransferase
MSDSISVISVTYKTGPVLFDMIASVLADPHVSQLILVNNGNPYSVYKHMEDVASRDKRMKVITGQGNVGFAAACNMGSDIATGNYLLFLNPDSILPLGLTDKLIAESKSHPEMHLIGARMLDRMGREQSGSRRAMLTPWSALVEALHLYKLFPDHPKFRRFKWHEDPVPEHVITVPAISGALMFMTKTNYLQLGRMDERFFLHVDDIDLCLRIKKAGGEVYFMPSPAVTHYGSTSKAPATIVEWHKTRSFVRFFFKHYSESYPAPFMWLLAVALWVRFGIQTVIRQFAAVVIPKTPVKNRADGN